MKLRHDNIDDIAKFIIEKHKKENFSYELTYEEKQLLRRMSAECFFNFVKDIPVDFSCGVFNTNMQGLVNIEYDKVTKYVARLDSGTILKKIQEYNNVSGTNKLAVSFIKAYGPSVMYVINYVRPCTEMPFTIDSDIHNCCIEVNKEEEFLRRVHDYIEEVVNFNNYTNDTPGGRKMWDGLNYISDDVLDKIKLVSVERRGFSLDNISKYSLKIREKLFISKYVVDDCVDDFLNQYGLRNRLNYQQINDLAKTLYINKCKSLGLKHDEIEIEVPQRETIEKIKSVCGKKEAQEIEEIYQSMLPKQKVKQAKMNL